MSSSSSSSGQPIKKKDFFNKGKGFDPRDFEDVEVEDFDSLSPPVSPVRSPPTTIVSGVTPSPASLLQDFPSNPQHHQQSPSSPPPAPPPPVYPLPSHHYGLYSPSGYPPPPPHNPYHPMCAPPPPSGYHHPSITGMPYGSLGGAVAAAAAAAAAARNTYHPYAGTPPSDGLWGGTGMEEDLSNGGDQEGGAGEPRHERGAHSQGQAPPTRQQKCSLCFNHGIIKEKKGHKWQCTFKNCECQRCVITKGRQKTMRDQQKLTRHLQKMQL